MTDFLSKGELYNLFYCVQGSYGEPAAKNIERSAMRRGMCLAVSQMIYTDYTDQDLQNALDVNILFSKQTIKIQALK